MKLTMKTFTRDFGLRRLQEAFKQSPKPYVKAGLLGGASARRPGEPLTNVQIGVIQEFGAPSVGIPERSFIRAPFHAKRKEYLAMLKALLRAGLKRREFSPRKALALIGERMAADFKKSAPGTPPPNAPSTLRRKLSLTRPGSKGVPLTLEDTGRMVQSITYAVVEGGK